MGYQKTMYRLGLGCWLVLLAGCDLSSSVIGEDRVATRDMEAKITVTAFDATQTEVWAQLRDMSDVTGDPVYVSLYNDYFRASTAGDLSVLDYDDDLFDNTAGISGEVKRLKPDTDIDPEEYSARFDGDYTGRTFTVSLLRKDKRVSAPNSAVTMPEGFTLSAPVSGQAFTLSSEDIVINWSPVTTAVNDNMFVVYTASCVNGNNYEHKFEVTPGGSADTGSFTISLADLQAEIPGISSDCNVNLKVQRSRLGTPDPAYGLGNITAHQERQVRITVNP